MIDKKPSRKVPLAIFLGCIILPITIVVGMTVVTLVIRNMIQ